MTTTSPAPVADPAAVESFVGRALGDLAGTMSVLLATLGDRLGLFRALAEAGPLTDGQLAERTGIDARYAREWLAGMTAAGYLRTGPADTFELPPEHVPVVAQEDGPVFFAGVWQEIAGTLPHLDAIAAAFRTGGGVPPEAYGPGFWQGIERFS